MLQGKTYKIITCNFVTNNLLKYTTYVFDNYLAKMNS